MTKGLVALGVLLALATTAAQASASGGHGESGHSGGPRAGRNSTSTTGTCHGLTLSVVPYVSDHGAAAGFWTLAGKTSRACDGTDSYAVDFVGRSADPICTATIAEVRGSASRPTYYGAKPLSRFRRVFSLPGSCAGRPQTIAASLVDVRSGAVLGRATTTFTP
jgi:hypothetical protein